MASAPSSSSLEDETDEPPAKRPSLRHFEGACQYKGDDPLEVCDGIIPDPVQDFGGNDSCHDNNETETADDNQTDLEKVTSAVTCRLFMTRTSEDRPETFPLPGDEGENCEREGTGWMIKVDKFTEEEGLSCECQECCSGKQTPNKTWGEVYIKTKCSMVNSDEQAKRTKCQFFCEVSTADLNISKLTAQKIVWSDNKGEWCQILCATHDMDLVNILYNAHMDWRNQMRKAGYSYHHYLEWTPSSSVHCEKFEEDDCYRILPEYQRAGARGAEEVGLQQRRRKCYKNPGHFGFKPVEDFNIEDLPSRYRDKLVVDWVRATSDLTCRLSVSRISGDRPDTWPDDSDQLYPFSAFRGKNLLMTGTGGMIHVGIFRHKDNKNCDCECNECQKPGNTPKKTWGEVYITTANHVVYDTEEVGHTKCHFFYDSHELDIKNVLTLSGGKVVGSDITGDWCQIVYVTHDIELLDRLYEIHRRWYILCRKVNVKYEKHTGVGCDRNVDHDLCILVSHPHGCSKQVTVGTWTHRAVVGGDDYKFEKCYYRYNTPTCPGSSGSQVMTMYAGREGVYWFFKPPTHSQGRPGNDNNSGVGEEWVI